MYNLFAELERQPQRIQPIIVRIITPITEQRLSAAWGGRRGAERARVRSATPSREACLAASYLEKGFLEMHIDLNTMSAGLIKRAPRCIFAHGTYPLCILHLCKPV